MTDSRTDRRRQILGDFGASPPVATEILAADDVPYDRTKAGHAGPLPLDDAPLVVPWRAWARDAGADGVLETLRRHLVQLQFPVRAGMSDDDAYRRATRRGDMTAAEAFAPGLELQRPDRLELTVHSTMAGGVPILVAGTRDDFVLLVQALTGRNEPVAVPDSMGACLVKGLNNWSRIAQYRAEWAARTGGDDQAWAEEFRTLIPRKSLYQDHIVILSRGPYSATPHTAAGLSEADWLDQSLAIRREHELAHYFTYRVFGTMRSHVVDELIADFVGLVLGRGRYDARLARHFLGIEAFPAYREGGRLENYRGEPPLSGDAFKVMQALAVRATDNLEALADRVSPVAGDLHTVGQLTLALVTLTIEELASADLPALVSGDQP